MLRGCYMKALLFFIQFKKNHKQTICADFLIQLILLLINLTKRSK